MKHNLSLPKLEPLEQRTLLSTCHVTRLSDTGVGKGFRGDLRYCINKVNDEPGPDTIDFTVTGTISLTGALPDLASDIDMQGPGASLLTIRRDSTDAYRVLTVAAGTVSITGLTLSNGHTTVGGGIYNQADLLLEDVAVSYNFATEQGGGIYNGGRLEVRLTSVDNNRVEMPGSASHYFGGAGFYNTGELTMEYSQITLNVGFTIGRLAGGGLHNAEGGTATIRFSTISDNDNGTASAGNTSSYPYGGGIYTAGTLTLDSSAVLRNSATDALSGGALAFAAGGGIHTTCTSNATLIVNSTIAQNDATSSEVWDNSYGGGVYAACPNVTIKNSTITANLAKAGYAGGGGIDGGVYLYNSIVANNSITDSAMYGPDYGGSLKGSGFNIFGKSVGASGFVDTDVLDVDPKLGALADNGGPTLTVALLPGSPAIDAGFNTFDVPAFDQRGPGFPRIVNGTVDIGAFEAQSSSAPTAPIIGGDRTSLPLVTWRPAPEPVTEAEVPHSFTLSGDTARSTEEAEEVVVRIEQKSILWMRPLSRTASQADIQMEDGQIDAEYSSVGYN